MHPCLVPLQEHVILIWHDEMPEFHNILALQYKDEVSLLLGEYLQTLQEGVRPVKAGTEPGQLGETRTKLIFFLETSTYYVPERLLAHFPFDGEFIGIIS